MWRFSIRQYCRDVEPGPMVDDSQGLRYAEWDIAKLVLLPKKGDLLLCKNWRGICLLDIASKILSSLLVRRMQIVMEEEGRLLWRKRAWQSKLELLMGIDGLFAVNIGLQKREEHNLETME